MSAAHRTFFASPDASSKTLTGRTLGLALQENSGALIRLQAPNQSAVCLFSRNLLSEVIWRKYLADKRA